MVIEFSHPSRSKSVSTQTFKYLPGQKEYLPRYIDIWKRIFSGDLTSPVARMLMELTEEATMKEASKQGRQIMAAHKLTPPARAELIEKAGEEAIRQVARAPQEVWKESANVLSRYAFPQLATHQRSKAEGGGGGGLCCFIFIASKQEDSLLSYVRRYKDSHFPKTSFVAQGYKRLALILVPLMKRSKLVERLVKITMVDPLSFYARSFYHRDMIGMACFHLIAKIWVSIYSLIGRICGESKWKRYLELGKLLK